MTPNEKKIIALLAEKHIDAKTIERNSDREYDLSLKGNYSDKAPYMAGCAFSAWLPLLAIRELVLWTSSEVASLTDYPDMCEQGDWSGVRDTEKENIWLIFEKFVLGNP